jgi:hypothetical protein
MIVSIRRSHHTYNRVSTCIFTKAVIDPPIDAHLNSVLFFVNVPVLSENTYLICPRSSFIFKALHWNFEFDDSSCRSLPSLTNSIDIYNEIGNRDDDLIHNLWHEECNEYLHPDGIAKKGGCHRSESDGVAARGGVSHACLRRNRSMTGYGKGLSGGWGGELGSPTLPSLRFVRPRGGGRRES